MQQSSEKPSGDAAPAEKNPFAAPSISLPKGGGAVKGIGEKFAANPVTGTGSLSVPLPASPGRGGFGPSLALSYDSGSGNGVFGFGWGVGLPSITRKTDKGLPLYHDSSESDTFILSGAEDLVPVPTPTDLEFPNTHKVQLYRPRIEGLFARIERWTSESDPTDMHWRSISKDNITTLYGKTANARIVDPQDGSRIFTWLICESFNDKGNAIKYVYAEEDSKNVVLEQANERNRSDKSRKTNRYLKRVLYGNQTSRLDQPNLESMQWHFELVMDYGEHDKENPTPQAASGKTWPVRPDPFSSHRSGFEVRTYRRCERVLMFHRFNEFVNGPLLVRSLEMVYNDYTYPIANSERAELEHQGSTKINSVITQLIVSGHRKNAQGEMVKRSMPPLELTYSRPSIQSTVEELTDATSYENLPYGVDGQAYQWVDLFSEGLSGVLTEQASAWFYKPNLGDGRLGASQVVLEKPSMSLEGRAQLMDLAGDGLLDLVQMNPPVAGFFERNGDDTWTNFRAFASQPNVRWDDPNLKFVDLTGDGHADVMITEDDVIAWHPSLAEDGFGPRAFVRTPFDEENGPRVVFSDGTQNVQLADLSGDGLSDLVRIRNGEVCYWPNLGYGRFGAKVTMDDAPLFDFPDQFNPARVRLADIDGSGVTDITYLGSDDVRMYFNRSGNSWSPAHRLEAFPMVDNLSDVTVVDLLGNGTACLVWSSGLPGDARAPLRFVNLMGEENPVTKKIEAQKPHLLVKTNNNMGMTTEVEYAASTKFYLEDQRAGKPWVTRLPFPVHCVERTTMTDSWRKMTFSSRYSYHHGFFDGVEREFRGFGRVEQIDAETYGQFAAGNIASPYITDDRTLYQPPIKTVTWYHTGAFLDRERILSHYKDEYFPNGFKGDRFDGTFKENALPEPDFADADLSAEEWREALRACKGMMLRQEIYELDVDALQAGKHVPVKLFSTAYHNCHIDRLQAKGNNRFAVFHATESEAITYNYELDLRPAKLEPDPRIAHTLNLRIDELGNVQQSVAVVYPRIKPFEDASLTAHLKTIRAVQSELHITYTETRYTKDVVGLDQHRLRVPCEVMTFELTGIKEKLHENDPAFKHFTLEEMRRLNLSDKYPSLAQAGDQVLVQRIDYEVLPKNTIPERRIVEHVRMLFFNENLNDPLPFGDHGRLGLPFENYKLAMTQTLLEKIIGRERLAGEAQRELSDPNVSGYLSGTDLANRFGGLETAGQYWVRSGIMGFNTNASSHFYLPEKYDDPFGNTTLLEFDPYDLFPKSSKDALGNTTSVEAFDFRVMAPTRLKDINGNFSEVVFDTLGLPAATAVMGKDNEGDNLIGFNDALLDPPLETVLNFFANEYNPDEARRLLGNATARHLYSLGETTGPSNTILYGQHPACAAGIVREEHVAQLAAGQTNEVQAAFEYTDGGGNVIVKKVQAEPETPGGPLRWIASGKTILNNKGKPVKQFEPYFTDIDRTRDVKHRFEEPREIGVTPVMFYDAPGRLVRTELPDGTFSRVEFTPWHVTSFDQNDTVLEPGSTWLKDMRDGTSTQPATPETRRAAQLTERHANTPAMTFLDSLGREVVSIAHNKTQNGSDTVEEKYLTFTKMDAEGKPLWIRDARGNLVMQYINPPVPNNQTADPISGFVPCYDIAGNLLFQHSMDAGDRWMLPDATGKPMWGWDDRKQITRVTYDNLRRPTHSSVKLEDGTTKLTERIVYGERLESAEAQRLNLRGKPYLMLDGAGTVTNDGHDFKGNPLSITRRIAREYNVTLDWSVLEPTLNVADANEPDGFAKLNVDALKAVVEAMLDPEHRPYTTRTRFDALNRLVEQITPDGSVFVPTYNAANLLEQDRVDLHRERDDPNFPVDSVTFITDIDYNAKGQRTRIVYQNRMVTAYEYDEKTFRLIRMVSAKASLNENLETFDPASPTLQAGRRWQDLNYTYDPVGNITEIHDNADAADFLKPVQARLGPVEPINRYEYDATYRLTSATGREHDTQTTHASIAPARTVNTSNRDHPFTGWQGENMGARGDLQHLRQYTQTYRYDPVGNIMEFKHRMGNENWIRTYTYAPDSNRLDTTVVPNREAFHQYEYNQHGSMTTMAHLPELTWNHKEQLIHADLDGGGHAFYTYDSSGQRVRKVVERNGGLKTERVYVGGFEVYREISGSASPSVTLERETLHATDNTQRVMMVETQTQGAIPSDMPRVVLRYQLNNHLGSSSVELDRNGAFLSFEEYHPYGTSSFQAADGVTRVSLKRYRYTGMERDEETGLSYHAARYNVPWIVGWMSCDPIGIKDGINLYLFSKNNPLVYTDKSGKQAASFSVGGLVNPIPIPMPDPITEVERGFSQLLQFFAGGRSDYANGHIVYVPGFGGVYGGAISTATLRILPLEANPTQLSAEGADFGAQFVPYADSSLRLITGETVSGRQANRLQAGLDGCSLRMG
jgi:RHS repeat-associated protein